MIAVDTGIIKLILFATVVIAMPIFWVLKAIILNVIINNIPMIRAGSVKSEETKSIGEKEMP